MPKTRTHNTNTHTHTHTHTVHILTYMHTDALLAGNYSFNLCDPEPEVSFLFLYIYIEFDMAFVRSHFITGINEW